MDSGVAGYSIEDGQKNLATTDSQKQFDGCRWIMVSLSKNSPRSWFGWLKEMGLTYFKRYRMEFDLSGEVFPAIPPPPNYEFVAYDHELIRDHAIAKYSSFRQELDANVFPCLGRREGCLRLMREIVRRGGFVPEATWLLRYREHPNSFPEPVGTVQGLQCEDWGAIQNLGISQLHRGRGLGTMLLRHAALGFREAGLQRMHLEVTTDNTAAVRLYERLGFRRAKVVYKAAEVAMA